MAWSSVQRNCNRSGCRQLTSKRYCPEHEREAALRWSRERTRKPMQGATLYDGRWRAYSKSYLLAEPRCRACGERASVLDHIRPHRGDHSLFWDSSNHQPLCRPCHGRKTAAEDGGFGNRKKEEGQA